MSQQTTDVLEQKARELAIDICGSFVSNDPLLYCPAEVKRITDRASAFAREIVEQCAKKVCFCCRDSGYASVQKIGRDWRHKDTGYDIRCLAHAIWEAFGRKDSHGS